MSNEFCIAPCHLLNCPAGSNVDSCGLAEDLRPETVIPYPGQDWEASRQGKLLQSTSYEKYSECLADPGRLVASILA